MTRISLARAGVVAMTLTPMLAGCRSRPQTPTWPSEPADLAGKVVEVRVVRGLPGLEVRPSGGTQSAGDIRQLRVRVTASRTSAPGMDAWVGVDGVTQVARSEARTDLSITPELNGAFVRVWFRGVARKSSPTETVAMARIVAVDSVAQVEAGR